MASTDVNMPFLTHPLVSMSGTEAHRMLQIRATLREAKSGLPLAFHPAYLLRTPHNCGTFLARLVVLRAF